MYKISQLGMIYSLEYLIFVCQAMSNQSLAHSDVNSLFSKHNMFWLPYSFIFFSRLDIPLWFMGSLHKKT